MTRANRLLLPIGLPVVLLLGLLLPSTGSALDSVSLAGVRVADLCVVLIFGINGLQMRLTGVADPRLLRALMLVMGINLVLAPGLALLVIRGIELPLGVLVGMTLMASVPTTLSSGAVIAINAGGDRVWALALTVITVLVGSVTAPLAVSTILSAAVTIDPWPLLLNTAVIVLVPTAAGYLLRRWRDPTTPAWLPLVPSVAVLTMVWMTMSSNAEAAREMAPALLLVMVAVGAVGHGILLAVAALGSRRMPHEHAMPVLFIASQKTLPLAITILFLLVEEVPQIAPVAAVATVTAVVWHFIQVFADSLLGNRLQHRVPRRQS